MLGSHAPCRYPQAGPDDNGRLTALYSCFSSELTGASPRRVGSTKPLIFVLVSVITINAVRLDLQRSTNISRYFRAPFANTARNAVLVANRCPESPCHGKRMRRPMGDILSFTLCLVPEGRHFLAGRYGWVKGAPPTHALRTHTNS